MAGKSKVLMERRKTTAMDEKLVDKLELPLVDAFVIRQLLSWDCSQLWEIRIEPKRGGGTLHGRCYLPCNGSDGKPLRAKTGHYRISVAVKTTGGYPFSKDLEIGATQRDGKLVILKDRVTFGSYMEKVVFCVGHEMSHFLCHSKQIDKLDTEAQANRMGIAWLKAWREWLVDGMGSVVTAVA